MGSLVSYERDGSVAVLTLDDGKANAMSPAMIAAVNGALDRAQQDGATVLLTGRPGVFCGGFDLKLMRSGGVAALQMIRGGFQLAARLLGFPYPVVMASSGHAVAMGAFLVLSGDYSLGAQGDFNYQANEVAIGIGVPRAAVAICQHRLNPSHLGRATMLSEAFSPTDAVAAGFVHELASPEDLMATARERARAFSELDMRAHVETKLRVRAGTLKRIEHGLRADTVGLGVLGARKLLGAQVGPRSAK